MLWANLTQEFIDHHANTRQLVQNLKHSIMFESHLKFQWSVRCAVKFDFESEPLPIVASYFQSNVLGQRLLSKMSEKGGQSKVHFKSVQLSAKPEFRVIFTDIFELGDSSQVANGTLWDVSDGALDHLSTRILSSNQPLWGTQDTDHGSLRGSISDLRFDPLGKTRFNLWEVALQKKPRPHTLEVLREVFIVLNKLQPRSTEEIGHYHP